MEPIAKESLSEKAAAAIEKAIRRGHFSGVLPGYRDLCRTLEVSRTVLEPALALLTRKGVIRSPGPRKRYLVATNGDRPTNTAERKLWVLEPIEGQSRSGTPSAFTEPFKKRLTKLGWHLEWTTMEVDQRRSGNKRWERMLRLQNPDAILLVSPHRRTSEWAVNCGVPVFCLGGDVVGLPLPVVGFKSTHMVGEAVRHLLDAGHRDLCLALAAHTPGFVSKVRDAMERELAAHGLPFVSGWNAPLAGRNMPDMIVEILEARFSRRIPEALLVFGHGGLHTAMGFLLSRGIRMPEEISLVMLGDRQEIPWFHPPIASFDFQWNRVVSHLIRWLSRENLSAPCPPALLHPKWVKGGSVARRVQ